VHTSKGVFIRLKILRHVTNGFTSPPKEGVLRIFVALKNPSPWLGFNPRTLGPMANTLTITPPRRQVSVMIFWFVMPCGLVGGYQVFVRTYCLHLQGFTSQKCTVHTCMGPHPVSFIMGTGVSYPGSGGWGLNLHRLPRLRIRGAKPRLPYTSAYLSA
jgi:hypothetical protein